MMQLRYNYRQKLTLKFLLYWKKVSIAAVLRTAFSRIISIFLCKKLKKKAKKKKKKKKKM